MSWGRDPFTWRARTTPRSPSNTFCWRCFGSVRSFVIDLAAGGYSVAMYFNGATTAGLTILLTGTVAAGDVYVVAQATASPVILAQADQTNGAGWFNGDDAVVLRKGGTDIDVIGQVGFDPGTEWGTGLTSTMDNTLRRKATIEAGDTNGADAFDPPSSGTASRTTRSTDSARNGSTPTARRHRPICRDDRRRQTTRATWP